MSDVLDPAELDDLLIEGLTAAFNGAFDLARSGNELSILFNEQEFFGEDFLHAFIADTYGAFREWKPGAPKTFKELQSESFRINFKNYETGITIPHSLFIRGARNPGQLADLLSGFLAERAVKEGETAFKHRVRLMIQALRNGETATNTYDGVAFFSASHPANTVSGGGSNLATGSGTRWYLLDANAGSPFTVTWNQNFVDQRTLHPDITPLGQGYVSAVDGVNSQTFKDFNRVRYSIEANAGVAYGAWQTMYLSREALDTDNLNSAMVAMQSYLDDEGHPLAIRPTHILVPPSLENTARTLLRAIDASGASNPLAGALQIIVSPLLAITP